MTTINAYDKFVDTVSMLELCEMLRRFKRYPRTIGVNYEKQNNIRKFQINILFKKLETLLKFIEKIPSK